MMNARIAERVQDPPRFLAETRGCVKNTPEFRRVLGLPRHHWEEPSDLAARVTEYLKLPAGTMTLRPEAAAMSAALDLYVQSNAPSDYVTMAAESVRQVVQSDLRVLVSFPLADGAEAADLP